MPSILERISTALGLKRDTGDVMTPDPPALKNGRQTYSGEFDYYSQFTFIPRKIYENVDLSNILEQKSLNFEQLLSLLPDLDPDVSLALWNIVRLSNRDHTVQVYAPIGESVIDVRGQKLVEQFMDNINTRYGGIDNTINQLMMSAYLQGAICAEAVLNEKAHVVDLATVNPYTIYFRPKADGNTLNMYQYQIRPREPEVQQFLYNYVLLNEFSIWYIPVDPAIGDPYGRSPAAPALNDIFFNLQLMYDLRRVIHSQGWPRLDIKIITSTLRANAPAAYKNNEKLMTTWINKQTKDIQAQYDNIKPDDAFVHQDAVETSVINGASSGGRAFDPSALLQALERRVFRGLKQLPVFMGSNEGTTETHGTVQFEIFAAGVESFQKCVEKMMKNVLELFLRMEGIQSNVVFEFERIRTRDRLLDAQAATAEIANAIACRDEGWISNEQASIEITGSEPIMSDEEIQAQKDTQHQQELEKIQAKAKLSPTKDDTTIDDSNNTDASQVPPANLAPKKANNARPNISPAVKKRQKTLQDNFTGSLNKSFGKLQNALTLTKMCREIVEDYPRTTDINKIEQSSPIYKNIKNIVGKYFNTDKTKAILDDMSERAAEFIIDAYNLQGQATLDAMAGQKTIFEDQTFSLNDAGISDMIDQRANFTMNQSIWETSQNQIVTSIVNGYNEGKTPAEMSTEIKAMFSEDGMTGMQADRIARTELAWGYGKASQDTMVKNSVTQKVWLLGDSDACPICQDNASQGPISVNNSFDSGDESEPAHPNCECAIDAYIDDNFVDPAEVWTGGSDDISD